MNIKIFFSLLISLALLTSVGFANISNQEFQLMEKNIVGQELPGFAGFLFGNERINLYVTDSNGAEATFSIITKDNKFVSLKSGIIENPSLNVYTDEQTIRTILNSEDFAAEFKKALDNNQVRYESVGILNTIKFGFASFISGILSLFS